MKLDNLNIGLAITGSFCTLNSFIGNIMELASAAKSVTPIFSEAVNSFDTRFSTGTERKEIIEEITGVKAITTIVEAEQIGPNRMFDVLVVAPCTGNTLAKLAAAITDSTVTMAVKAHLRNDLPVVIGISSNDILGQNAKNLGLMLERRNIYFVPFYQDDPKSKEKSVTFRNDLLIDTIDSAVRGKQLQPLLEMHP